MSTALHSQTARLTVDDVYEMLRTGALHEDDRVELLEGRLVPMSPKSGTHSACVRLLLQSLSDHYDRNYVSAEQPVDLDNHSQPEPDLCVARVSVHTLHEERRHPRPDECVLVVEMAYSSQYRDREKSGIYCRSGIPTYWLVDLADDVVTVFNDPGPEGYRSIERHRFADGVPLPDSDVILDLSLLLRESE